VSCFSHPPARPSVSPLSLHDALPICPVRSLKRRGWPPLLATWTVILVATMALVGVALVLIPQLTAGFEPLGADLSEAYDAVLAWLSEGPLGLSPADVQRYSESLIEQLPEQA